VPDIDIPDRQEDGTRSEIIGGRVPRSGFPTAAEATVIGGKAAPGVQSGVLRRLRLLSGLVMFAYIAIHLANHALGIISLSLAEGGLRLEVAFWRSPFARCYSMVRP
jgi:hypothetical protein